MCYSNISINSVGVMMHSVNRWITLMTSLKNRSYLLESVIYENALVLILSNNVISFFISLFYWNALAKYYE